MEGATTGKMASMLRSYRPRLASTCWRARSMSRFWELATRTTVGRSMARSSRYMGGMGEPVMSRETAGWVEGESFGGGCGWSGVAEQPVNRQTRDRETRRNWEGEAPAE